MHGVARAKAVILAVGMLMLSMSALGDADLEAALADPSVSAVGRGLAVAEAAERADAGFGDELVSVQMVLHDGRGTRSERAMRMATLEGADVGERSLIVFDAPRDQRGTALLTWNQAEGEDDQWLYLPALRRVKKIAARNRSGPFVGSEFAFEDLTADDKAHYRWRYVGETACGDGHCYEVEREPVESWSGYSRQQVFYDTASLRIERIEYFDRRGGHLKTLETSNWTQYLDRHWRPGMMTMRNHQTGRWTELIWSDYAFGNDLSSEDFTTAALQRLH